MPITISQALPSHKIQVLIYNLARTPQNEDFLVTLMVLGTISELMCAEMTCEECLIANAGFSLSKFKEECGENCSETCFDCIDACVDIYVCPFDCFENGNCCD